MNTLFSLFYPKSWRRAMAVMIVCGMVPLISSAQSGLQPILADSTATPTPTICMPGTPLPLAVGQPAIVAPGPSINLRQLPTKTAPLVMQLRGDTSIHLLAGPTCAEGLNWWQVTDGKVTGWMTEGSNKEVYIVAVSSDPSTVFHYDGTFPAMPIAFRNVRISYNGVFGKSVTMQVNDTTIPNDDSQSPLFGSRFISFDFNDVNADYLWVFPTRDIDLATGVSTPAPTTIAATQSTPTTCPYKGKNPSTLPVANGAATLLSAKTLTIRFSNNGGELRRHIDFMAQDYLAVTASNLLYNFQGLTDDGCYYIYGYFLVTLSVLPSSSADDQAFQQVDQSGANDTGGMTPAMAAYYASVKARIDSQPDSAFSPTLDQMDALIKSIVIN